MSIGRISLITVLLVFALGSMPIQTVSAKTLGVHLAQAPDDQPAPPPAGTETTPGGETPAPTVTPPSEPPPPPAVVTPPSETVPPPPTVPPAPSIPGDTVPGVTGSADIEETADIAPMTAVSVDELPTTGADLTPVLVLGFGLATTGTMFYRKRK